MSSHEQELAAMVRLLIDCVEGATPYQQAWDVEALLAEAYALLRRVEGVDDGR